MTVMNTVAALHKTYDWVHDVRTEMDAVLGDLSGVRLRGQDVMCGVYLHPTAYYVPDNLRGGRMKTADGSDMIMHSGGTGKETVEDIYQGKVLRILKMGPQAFNPDVFPSLEGEWAGRDRLPKVGDWVFCRCNDGVQFSYKGAGSRKTTMFDNIEKMPSDGGWPCRLISFNDIISVVDEPTRVV